MENRNAHLFRINYMPDLFVLLLSCVMVTSLPTKESIADTMEKDTNLCKEINLILFESLYTKNCTMSEYPVQPWDNQENTLDKYLCLGVYDTAYKICQYFNHSRSPLLLNSVAIFNSNVEKFFPNEKSPLGGDPPTEDKEEKYCRNNLQGFTSMYNKTKIYWGPLSDRLNKPNMCQRICFDFNVIFRPLCAVFAWIKSIDDEMKNTNTSVTHNNSMAVLKTLEDRQPVDSKLELELKESEKKFEVKESEEQLHDKLKNIPNSVLSEQTQPNTEKVEPDFEKPNKHETQIALNNTFPKIVDHEKEKKKESVGNVKDEINAKGPKALDNVPNKEEIDKKDNVEEINAEETDRKPEIDDIKTSTISENTQDHYGAGNVDDDMGDSDDNDDVLPQPIETGNQNENPQESIKQKNSLPYPIRTEGDSHFFTYFTVTTVACIVCYVGYHNKQKILAIVLEGRRSRNSRGRRRPSTASYRKLDCTLEEAVTSQCNANVTHVIY